MLKIHFSSSECFTNCFSVKFCSVCLQSCVLFPVIVCTFWWAVLRGKQCGCVVIILQTFCTCLVESRLVHWHENDCTVVQVSWSVHRMWFLGDGIVFFAFGNIRTVLYVIIRHRTWPPLHNFIAIIGNNTMAWWLSFSIQCDTSVTNSLWCQISFFYSY